MGRFPCLFILPEKIPCWKCTVLGFFLIYLFLAASPSPPIVTELWSWTCFHVADLFLHLSDLQRQTEEGRPPPDQSLIKTGGLLWIFRNGEDLLKSGEFLTVVQAYGSIDSIVTVITGKPWAIMLLPPKDRVLISKSTSSLVISQNVLWEDFSLLNMLNSFL